MGRQNPHEEIDSLSSAQDRYLASKLRKHPRLLNAARQNLNRWMARDGKTIRPAFREWHLILTRLTAFEIANFLKSDTPMAKRLRQSSPFASLLTSKEERGIRQKHEKTRTRACR